MSKHNLRKHLVKQLGHAAQGVTLMVSLMRQGDSDALHHIRVQVRTIASVLQPFVDLPHMKPLRRSLDPVRFWVRKSNRVRDAEAQLELIVDLLPERYPKEVERYLAQKRKTLEQNRALLAQSKSLAKLPRRMARLAKTADECLGRVSAATLGCVVARTCEALLSALREDCAEGLQDAKRWHQARLRIKQLRYLIECFRDFLDERFVDFAADTKRVQESLGQLRDWQNLRAGMADVPAMDTWLAGQVRLEAELTREANAAMAFLDQKLAHWK